MTPLLSPLRFLAIRHGRWARYNVGFPVAGGVAIAAAVLLLPQSRPLVGDGGLLSQLQNPFAIMGGFFVAALTLVTADRSEVMIAPVGGDDPPKLKDEILSRRRFLAFLFGYLSFCCFGMLAVSFGADFLAPAMRAAIPDDWHNPLKGAASFVLGAILSHLAIATLLGLYYFTERLQTSDRRTAIGGSGASGGT